MGCALLANQLLFRATQSAAGALNIRICLPACLLACLPQVSSNLKIAKDTRRKQGLTALLEALLKLQQANNLQRALKWVLWPVHFPACLPRLLLLLPVYQLNCHA